MWLRGEGLGFRGFARAVQNTPSEAVLVGTVATCIPTRRPKKAFDNENLSGFGAHCLKISKIRDPNEQHQ